MSTRLLATLAQEKQVTVVHGHAVIRDPEEVKNPSNKPEASSSLTPKP